MRREGLTDVLTNDKHLKKEVSTLSFEISGNVSAYLRSSHERSPAKCVFCVLAPDEASYITGQTLYACGGLTLFLEFRVAWWS
jgi:hypothetical protein